MDTIWTFLKGPVGSALRVFAGLVLGYVVADLLNDGAVSISFDELSTWIAAAAAVALPIVIAAINPADPRFGNGG